MSALKGLVVLLALLAMFAPVGIEAQDPEPDSDIDAAIAEWAAMEADAWTWDTCCLHMEERTAEYEVELAAGLTEADTLAEWCLEQRAEAYAESCAAWRSLRARAGQSNDLIDDDETLALRCACVCALSTAENCALCLEDPTDPALLEIPGVCQCIVRH